MMGAESSATILACTIALQVCLGYFDYWIKEFIRTRDLGEYPTFYILGFSLTIIFLTGPIGFMSY